MNMKRCNVWKNGCGASLSFPGVFFCRNLPMFAIEKLPKPSLPEVVGLCVCLFVLRLYCTGLLLIDFGEENPTRPVWSDVSWPL